MAIAWAFGFIGAKRYRRILAAITSEQGKWKGRRGPMTIQIWKSERPTLDGQALEFSGRIFKHTITGYAGTVQEAIERLELVYRERTLINDPRRLAKESSTGVRRRRRPADHLRDKGDSAHPPDRARTARRTKAPHRAKE